MKALSALEVVFCPDQVSVRAFVLHQLWHLLVVIVVPVRVTQVVLVERLLMRHVGWNHALDLVVRLEFQLVSLKTLAILVDCWIALGFEVLLITASVLVIERKTILTEFRLRIYYIMISNVVLSFLLHVVALSDS